MLGLLLATAAALPTLAGDFDRDGKRDVASIVRKGANYELVVRRGADLLHPVLIGKLGSRHADFFLARAAPGVARTWCGKGGGSDSDPCPRQSVRLRGGELTFGNRDASESVALWKGGRFEPILLSD